MGSETIQDEEVMKRIGEPVISDWSSTALVCIQGTEEGEVYGEVYSCYLEEPIWFSGVGDVVLGLDEICNWVDMPHVTTGPRFLNMKTERRYRGAGSHHPQADRTDLTYTMDQIPLKQTLKARGMLIVCMKYKQFSSLQGNIRGEITRGKVVNFRSTLGLTRMISVIQL